MVQKRKSNFSFAGKTTASAEKDRKEGSSYGYLILPKNVGVFSPKPGETVKLDIVPYIVTDPKHPDRNEKEEVAMVGDPWIRRPYLRHTGIGSNNDSYVCLASIGKKCPICEYRAKLILEKADEKDIQALKSSKRILYNVVPIDHEKFEEKIHILDISFHNFQKLLNEELKTGNIPDTYPNLEGGETLKTRFAAATVGDSKPFAQATRIDAIKRKEDYDEKILQKTANLDEVLKILSYDELRNALFEIDETEDGGKLSDEDEKPIRKKRRDEEEEEEEDDTPRKKKSLKDEEEEEEDEKPRRSSISRRRREEEEEDDTPKHTSSKKQKCPHGYRFGVDTDEYDECPDCKVFDDCLEAKEG